jgi:hypothetical protein
MGSQFKRIDITFDRYNKTSIKEATQKTERGKRLIQIVTESKDVPLPKDWHAFIGQDENKADLA